jgi:hypothetical protein
MIRKKHAPNVIRGVRARSKTIDDEARVAPPIDLIRRNIKKRHWEENDAGTENTV